VNGSSASTILFLSEGSRRQTVVAERLAQTGLRVVAASDVSQALQLLSSRPLALCLIDLAGERSPLAAIRAIRAQHPHTPIAGLFDASRPLRGAEAIHAGAIDLLPWPFDEREATTVLANARDLHPVAGEPKGFTVSSPVDLLVAQSPAMRRVIEMVKQAARGRNGVCISGESGTGRRLIARTIHQLGNESGDRPFVIEDCAGDTPQELDRRLFGTNSTMPPTFTQRSGTDQIATMGALYQARGGTLLLLNLIETPARVQARLARVLRDREAVVIDAKASVVELDLQVIATFDMSVDAAVADGRLRGDLYKQIAQVRIDVPALRRRREDIPLLAVQMLKQICSTNQMAEKHFSRAVVQVLSALPWSGNATELRALLTTLVKSVDRQVIHLEDLLEHARLDGGAEPMEIGSTLRDAKARFERDCISAVLARHHGRVPEAAKALGIQRTNLYRKIRQLNVARSLLSARK
jgi:DNA-binding NtrC family response regulator